MRLAVSAGFLARAEIYLVFCRIKDSGVRALVKTEAVQDWGLRLVVFAAVVGTWELFLSRSQNFLLPKFTEMVSAFFHLLFVDGRFWEALYISNQALLLGYAFSLAIGIPAFLRRALQVLDVLVVLLTDVFHQLV